jgi:hypothetical protein
MSYNALGSYRGYGNYGGQDYVGSLQTVSDPDATYAQMTRDDYNRYVQDYRPFEEKLLNQAQTDTTLIDSARENSEIASGLMTGVVARNAERYGTNLTPAQLQEQARSLDRANTLGAAQSINDARIAQKETNQAAIADLVNIGQGVNRSSLSQMQGAAQSATQRKNAYDSAKAASKAQTYSTIGGLASAAIFAFAF